MDRLANLAPVPMSSHSADPRAVVLYDGVCNLCNASIRFIVDRDPDGYFHYASLQSATGRHLARVCEDPDAMQTVVLLEGGRCYTRSAAVLRIFRRLHLAWPLMMGFIVVPPVVRDAVYRFISEKRYDWFGKQDACRLPAPHERERFLDADESAAG